MSIYKFFVVIFLGLLIMTNIRPSIAQIVVIENSDVLLPDKNEYYDFKLDIVWGLKYPPNPQDGKTCKLSLEDPETGCKIRIEFYSKQNKKNINDAFEYIPRPERDFNESSYSKKIKAEYVIHYVSIDDLNNERLAYDVYVSDGTIVLHAQAFMMKKTNKDGNLRKYALNENNINRVDSIVIKILDRMTVLGLTSKPKESAPEWAKRQVAERLAKRKQ